MSSAAVVIGALSVKIEIRHPSHLDYAYAGNRHVVSFVLADFRTFSQIPEILIFILIPFYLDLYQSVSVCKKILKKLPVFIYETRLSFKKEIYYPDMALPIPQLPISFTFTILIRFTLKRFCIRI